MEQLIKKGLESLTVALSGDKSRVKKIMETFISETPGLFNKIESSLANEKWMEAAGLIHKSKSRYGYLGLNEEMIMLSQVEDELKGGHTSTEHIKVIEHFSELNEKIMSVLKKIGYGTEKTVPSNADLPLRGKVVLVAEDDEINAMVFELFIKATGATVLLAADGNEALNITLNMKPDFIFMDVHMPFFSGLEAITELRKKGIDCPIISLSASTRLNEQQNSIAAGANDFLMKPVNKESITTALMKYLG